MIKTSYGIFKYLPDSIWVKIFKFDSTYYEKFNIVMNELLNVTGMWQIYFHDQNLRYSFSTSKYHSLKEIKKLCDYWNNEFLKQTFTSSYEQYYDKRDKFCSAIHISDYSNPVTYFPRLKANILSSKIIKNWEKNKMIKYNV